MNAAPTASGTRTVVTYGAGSYFTLGDNKFEGKKLPMPIVAEALARFADRPVVDFTELKGSYDFIMPDDFRAMMVRAAIVQGALLSPEVLKLVDASSGDTLFNAVEKLGLKLEPRKAPIEMLMIDQALRTPPEIDRRCVSALVVAGLPCKPDPMKVRCPHLKHNAQNHVDTAAVWEWDGEIIASGSCGRKTPPSRWCRLGGHFPETL